ncbi:CHAP domain-containing protein [Caballeronia sp. LZ029]|uniref:CHAP domain-containing protein n=1 Tax=Caballeronia sp. LZ029 TaxID=3038564 RepID=UPI00285BC5CF|nr:CHAP domain-containing protein [Caballeronia sp. LZ029]MDR5746778.1 CHAP domain-containing protein [Caballeronia sp. LZ029]
MKRRTVIKSGLALTAVHPFKNIWAQNADDADDYKDIQGPFPASFRLFGTNPASGPENEKARQILDSAPLKKDLLETARYFANITDKNDKGYLYNAQWPNVPGGHWNPVLVGFYQATSLPKPYVYKYGDTIDWCAAFMNYCLIRGGYQHTNDAMSGSFRSLGKPVPVNDAKPGDIIVFRKPGRDGDVGHGHVAIFLEQVSGGFRVLGGNQKAGKSYSSVNETTIIAPSKQLQFHSIRALSSLSRT